MNRMKHLFCVLLLAALGSFSFKANAYTERNMLQKAADETTLKNVLVMKQAWVPYPAYTDRAAWDSLMGPNKQRLIEAGEKLLDYKWQLIPATAYLEYERSGNRKIMEVPYGTPPRGRGSRWSGRNTPHALAVPPSLFSRAHTRSSRTFRPTGVRHRARYTSRKLMGKGPGGTPLIVGKYRQ